MKKLIPFAICLLVLIANGAYAGTITLTADDLIGTIETGVPAGDSNELEYATHLIEMYNDGLTIETYNSQDYTVSAGSNVPAPDLPDVIWVGKDNDFTVEGSYLYLLAKFGVGQAEGQRSELYYLNGQEGDLVGLDSSLSHITLFNEFTTTVPEPSLILLLGFGLGAVSLVSKRFKKN